MGSNSLAKVETVTFLDGNMGVTEKIKKAMYDIAKNFVYIGYLLWEVQEYEYYKEKGYKNVYEYAETELNFKRTTTKNMIAINREFGCAKQYLRDNIETGYSGPSMHLQQSYEKFQYSQLCEMLSMAPAQRSSVTPNMTVKEIRAMKSGQTSDQNALITSSTTRNKVSGQTSDQISVTINNVWVDIDKDLLSSILKAAGIPNRFKCWRIQIEGKPANE